MDPTQLQRILADPRRSPMTSWYDPAVLIRSGLRAVISEVFGRHSDRRLIEALGGQAQGAFDYSKDAGEESGEFWLDYAADLGDGWNSTYAVAYWLSQTELMLHSKEGESVATRAGRVLLFGGDQVYPYPSRNDYELKTEKPYATAFSARPVRPDVFAMPGNHDWYDSLVAFSRTFCRPERGFATCRVQQTRSYFALRLPHRWWVLGVDLQLGDDLDEPQVQYFQRVAETLEEDARIVLCVPEPQWIYDSHAAGESSPESAATQFLEQNILKRKISVFVAGDLHCYRRHEGADGVQKITWGGGGAFLRPTHVRHRAVLADGSQPRTVYPPAKQSSVDRVAQSAVPVPQSNVLLGAGDPVHDVRVAGVALFASGDCRRQSVGLHLHSRGARPDRGPVVGRSSWLHLSHSPIRTLNGIDSRGAAFTR